MSVGVWKRVGSPDKGFRYLTVKGAPLSSRAGLARVEALAIPPAWTGVEISPRGSDKVQATGYDAAGRKQYIYHSDYVAGRERKKYARLLTLARALPRMRALTNEHLRRKGVTRERVLATLARLLSRGYFRVGSERYALANETFGLATLRKSHLEVRGHDLIFRYRGKGSVEQRKVVADTPLVKILEEIMKLPGRRLFRYRDGEGKVRDVTSREVNDYLRQVLGGDFTAKDLRTWGGTVRAATILADLGPARSAHEADKNVVLACKLVASELGNTPAVCRSAYIHPDVIAGYLKGETIAAVMRKEPRPLEAEAPTAYYAEEAALMRFLEARQ
ncbi:MAG: DNA topoisomerase IB [Longimicrobiaceae bacterium]